MSKQPSGQLDTVMQESRVFPPPAEFAEARTEAETSEEDLGIGASRDDTILIDEEEDAGVEKIEKHEES